MARYFYYGIPGNENLDCTHALKSINFVVDAVFTHAPITEAIPANFTGNDLIAFADKLIKRNGNITTIFLQTNELTKSSPNMSPVPGSKVYLHPLEGHIANIYTKKLMNLKTILPLLKVVSIKKNKRTIKIARSTPYVIGDCNYILIGSPVHFGIICSQDGELRKYQLVTLVGNMERNEWLAYHLNKGWLAPYMSV
jgi:hypothetical protein